MSNIRKNIACILVLAMIAPSAGCSSKTKEEVQKNNAGKGGYTEEVVKLDQDTLLISEILKSGDEISYVDLCSNKKYKKKKGEDSFTVDDSASASRLADIENIISVSSGPSGELFVIYLDESTQDFAYIYIDKDGNKHQVQCDDMLVNAEFAEDGSLFGGAMTFTYEINTEQFTSKEVMMAGNETVGFDVIGDWVILIDELGAHIYDYKKKEEVTVPEVLNNFFKEKKKASFTGQMEFDLCAGEDGSMYIVAEDGIYRYVMNGNQIEKILDDSENYLGNPSYHANSIAVDEKGNIFIGFVEGIMTKYSYDAEMTENKSSELKVYSLEKNTTLVQAINTFSAENKDVKVDYRIGLKNGMTYTDAMKELTTQILSGDAPDIIMLDGLDVKNIISKNMLADLSASESTWNSDNSLVDNIVKWNTENDKLYSVACKFRIPAVAADKDVLKNIKSYSDIAAYSEKTRKEQNGDYAITCINSPETVIKNALIYTGNDIISDNSINKDALAKMYDDCCKVYKNDQSDDNIVISGGLSDIPEEYDFASKLANVISEPKAIALGTLNTFDCDYNLVTSLENCDQKINVDFRMGINEESSVFIPTCNLGIVESSSQKDSAVKFIETALSTAQQKIDNTDGFPVNKSALDYYYNKNAEGNNDTNYGMVGANGTDVCNINIEWLDKDEAKEFESYITKLNEPVMINEIITDIIIQTGRKCLDGNISPSDAADEAVKQLELKMKE